MKKGIEFIKANSLGNDFVILKNVELKRDQIEKICSRRFGIGCDQILVLKQEDNEAFIPDKINEFVIYNQDGTMAEACGNGTRCLVAWMAQHMEKRNARIHLTGPVGNLFGWLDAKDGDIVVEQGKANVGSIIRYGELCEVPRLPINANGLVEGIPVSIGNPHLVIFTLEPLNFDFLGLMLSKHEAFPLGTNVSFVRWIGDGHVEVTIWERGTGLTLSCGSAACAVASVMFSLGQNGPLRVEMPGGMITVWQDAEGTLFHKAPATFPFSGIWYLS